MVVAIENGLDQKDSMLEIRLAKVDLNFKNMTLLGELRLTRNETREATWPCIVIIVLNGIAHYLLRATS